MTFSREATYGDSDQPYDVARGTCWRCGSGEVRHHIMGMPSSPEAMDRAPDWVEWHAHRQPGFTRSCQACGQRWSDTDEL
jgi:hypothetical protein